MAIIQETVEVDVPVRTAYDQWTQFEDYPRFMENVEQVQQIDATTLAWRASIAGVEKRWQARITEQVPDRRIAWTSIDGARNDGTVTFNSEGAHRTRVTLQLQVEPDGPVESAGTALGLVRQSVHGDLQRFREFIEARGLETDGWRGEIHDGSEARGTGVQPSPVATTSGAGRAGGAGDIPGLDSTRTRS